MPCGPYRIDGFGCELASCIPLAVGEQPRSVRAPADRQQIGCAPCLLDSGTLVML
jgi:hypothetical protein